MNRETILIRCNAAAGAPTGATRHVDIGSLIDDRPDERVFRVHGSAFTSEDVFDAEMALIFEKTWVFLGHESEVAQPHDWLATSIGRQPVLVMRDGAGVLRAVHNSCSHRGALLTSSTCGNKRVHVCPYHAWSYGSDGRNLSINGKATGAYVPAFEARSQDLRPIARFGNYRGFLFGSLAAAVPPLEEHLGPARAFIDLLVDQGEHGIELIPGRVRYTFNANWKWQIENATDSYHFQSAHSTYIDTLERQKRKADEAGTKLTDTHVSSYVGFAQHRREIGRGAFDLGSGHSAMWGPTPTPEARPLHQSLEALQARVGETRAKWMLYTRNVNIWPNLQLYDNIASLIGMIRPVSAGCTEMITYCVGPKGEAPDARKRRIRHCEQFLNLGIANPDDIACYEACQTGLARQPDAWVDYARGMAIVQNGPSPHGAEIGIQPHEWVFGGFDLGDETGHQHGFRQWRHLMSAEAGA